MGFKKIVWFLNQNSYMPEDGPHIRHYAFGKYLAQKGYEPYVFAGNVLHHSGLIVDTCGKNYIIKKSDGVNFVYVKTTKYTRNNYKRILNVISYYLNVFSVCNDIAKQYGPPDIIYASTMYPTALIAGIKLARQYGIKCICETRDLIPEGFITSGAFKRDSFITKILAYFMREIYYRADALVFTMSGGSKYVVDNKWNLENGGKIDMSKVFYINNGVDLDLYERNSKDFILQDRDLENPNIFKVVYLGSIRFLNQIPLFIETARILKSKGYDNIKILMWGTGPEIDSINKQIRDLALENIVLKGYVEKKYIPSIASRANLFIGTGNSCAVGKYGISFNKLFDYFAAGKPTILPFKVSESIVDGTGAGVELENPMAEDLSNEIVRFCNMKDREYIEFCKNAKALSREFDYKKLTCDLEKVFSILQ